MSVVILILSLIGLFDSFYLTLEHFSSTASAVCPTTAFIDCGSVLTSRYSLILGIPLALIGLLHYSLLSVWITGKIITKKNIFAYLAVIESTVGLIASIYFVYLQIFILQSICLFCMVSALVSFALFFQIHSSWAKQRKFLLALVTVYLYKKILKPIFFSFDPETIHDFMVRVGETLGKISPGRAIANYLYRHEDDMFHQTIEGIEFKNPIGLAAGFDYEVRLTQTLSSLGFGFQTVGTITNFPYEGNAPPRLGRLPKSHSLIVNKGFKNIGIKMAIGKLRDKSFDIPVAISIGKSNLDSINTQQKSIADIVSAFKTAEKANLNISFYELNISCPNLKGKVSFYPPKNLNDLLKALSKLNLAKPVFIKMPISESTNTFLNILGVAAKHNFVDGVIIGNLYKSKKGNLSGKPTYKRSNELISLTYQKYKDRFVIIGCGGVFSAQDAYEKIKRGASLVQLITGMIFQGPGIISKLNFELAEILRRDGYNHISEAVGIKSR